jgi:hypothetical protein
LADCRYDKTCFKIELSLDKLFRRKQSQIYEIEWTIPHARNVGDCLLGAGRMRKFLPVAVGVSVLLAVAVGALGFFGLRARWDKIHNWDRRAQRGFEHVAVGMPRNQVELLMRSPGTKLQEFSLGQETGYEQKYAEARRSNSRYWLSWHNGIDYVYTVGFDDHDQVTCKASGGT